MEKIVFTLCSNNYLPQALLLMESFFVHHPEYLFVIGLVDKKTRKIRYPEGKNVRVIECDQVVPGSTLQEMAAVYKIVELNTSVKPFYFDYIFRNYPKADVVMYLDPDIYIYNSFNNVHDLLRDHDIVITPHSCHPIAIDRYKPSERSFLKYGIYNLGFLAVKRSDNTQRFIDWFKERLASFCYGEANLGMYVDQLWINLVPLYFEKVHISRHLGLNCAYWNIQERKLSSESSGYRINGEFPLVFFHFSAININNFSGISKSQDRFDLQSRPDVVTILQQYAQQLKAKKLEQDYNIPCVYTQRNFFQKIRYYRNRLAIRKKLRV